MAKVLTGKVVSTSMNKTVVVEVAWHEPHPKYKKLMARSKKFKADINNMTVNVGDTVRIIETKPMAKGKYFKLEGGENSR